MIIGICTTKCFIDKYYSVGDTKVFNSIEECEKHPHFKLKNEIKSIKQEDPEKPEEEPKRRGRRPKSEEVE